VAGKGGNMASDKTIVWLTVAIIIFISVMVIAVYLVSTYSYPEIPISPPQKFITMPQPINKPGSPNASFTEEILCPSFKGIENPGCLVKFIDTSDRGNTKGLIYNWSFGDISNPNLYSSDIGNAYHVYAYAGRFTPTLWITNNNGSSIYEGSPILIMEPQ
jgi:hypothetical protein